MPKNISAKKLEYVLKITEECVNSGNLTELKTKLDNNKDLTKIILKNILNSSNQLVKSSKINMCILNPPQRASGGDREFGRAGEAGRPRRGPRGGRAAPCAR